MSGIDKGLSLVSVADVLFFNPVTDEYMGDGFALTDSTITQEVQTLEQDKKLAKFFSEEQINQIKNLLKVFSERRQG